jgi:hypothetical protein
MTASRIPMGERRNLTEAPHHTTKQDRFSLTRKAAWPRYRVLKSFSTADSPFALWTGSRPGHWLVVLVPTSQTTPPAPRPRAGQNPPAVEIEDFDCDFVALREIREEPHGSRTGWG